MAISSTSTYIKRYPWMMFVDGENLSISGYKIAKEKSIELISGRYFKKDTYLWLPPMTGHQTLGTGDIRIDTAPIRSFYYTSVQGDEPAIVDTRFRLRELQFHPVVFKKPSRDKKAKGVDIALTKDMLSNAYEGNFQVAVLVAGDGDYLPVVEELQRKGRNIYTCFFDSYTSNELKLYCDHFTDITNVFLQQWGKYIRDISNHTEK